MSHPENKVLTDDHRSSTNFFESDLILRSYLNSRLSREREPMRRWWSNLEKLGSLSATVMNSMSQKADAYPPQLKSRTKLGSDVNQVEFHPAYWDLMEIAAASEMFYFKYHPENEGDFEGIRHQMGFAIGQLYAMSELGQYCPHCMTDGAAYLIEKYGSDKDRERLLPHLGARNGQQLYSGAMFLTEKSGGSDVGANLSSAHQIQGAQYRLNGEKWFCSNVNADVIMALARTGPIEEGTRGLSLFLVEKRIPNGGRNPMDIVRLKDKLGVRSMATGEVRFQNTQAKRLGEEGEGFKVMAEMINISRNYNSVAALAGSRRAIVEAWQYLNHRNTFGKRAVNHALIREKFLELGSQYLADFLMVWRTLRAMDSAETGDETEQHLLRILTPLTKWWTAEQSVYAVRECMELMGGNGYIEDFVMPKLLRDVNVLPIWEGSGNIIVLDMLRASQKSQGLSLLFEWIEDASSQTDKYSEFIDEKLGEIQSIWKSIAGMDDRDQVEATAKPLFRQLIRLLQIALLIREGDSVGTERSEIALEYLVSNFEDSLQPRNPLTVEKLEKLIGWEY